MGHKETGCKSVNRIHLAKGRIQWLALVNTVMKFWIP